MTGSPPDLDKPSQLSLAEAISCFVADSRPLPGDRRAPWRLRAEYSPPVVVSSGGGAVITDRPAQAVLGLAVAFAIEDLAHTLDAYDAGSWSLLDVETLLVRRQEAIARLVQGQVEDPHLAQLYRREVEAVYGSTMSDLHHAPPRKIHAGTHCRPDPSRSRSPCSAM
jgi:hypothetical protein